MVTVYIGAGLANRMFQYAFALYLQNKGLHVDIDEHTFKPRYDFEDTKLANVFAGIDLPETPLNKMSYKPYFPTWLSKLYRGRFYKAYRYLLEYLKPDKRYIERYRLTYEPNIYKRASKDCYYNGFWITHKYFQPYEKDIRRAFVFKDFVSEKNKIIAQRIQQENAVAVHFRKNIDYINGPGKECTVSYYLKAIQYIKDHTENPKFYFFSDNWEWVRQNIGDKVDYTAVDWNPPTGPESHCDMQLMSLCKHNITANSTYSWWAAYLNDNPEKIVIGPLKWFENVKDIRIIIPEDWILIGRD